MLVTISNFNECLGILKSSNRIAWDCETTGLNSFKEDRLFSLIISCVSGDFYFNFKNYIDENSLALPRSMLLDLNEISMDRSKTHIGQNFKFDLHMLAKEGIFFRGTLHDTMILDRIYYNQSLRYDLGSIAMRWQEKKLDIVWDYIKQNKLITKTNFERFNKVEEKPHFDKVPLYLIQEYGEKDASTTLNIATKILNAISDEDESIDSSAPNQQKVIENESRLIQTLFEMEHLGVQLDIDYCNEALDYYNYTMSIIEGEFKSKTGLDFVKGTTVFEEAFSSEKEKWEKTEKGNWRWDSNVLETLENPSARLAIEWAEAKKQSEYFANFLFFCDTLGVIHPDFQSGGTVTGRLSCRDPNLQNLTNPDKYESATFAATFPVRKSFIPREGYFFAMLDYSQIEFRLVLDYAYANDLINEVLKGHDVHTATATLAKVTRKEAKTVNFLSIYGGGVAKLAQNLFPTKGSKTQISAIYKKMFGYRLTHAEMLVLCNISSDLFAYNSPFIEQAYKIQASIFKAAPEIKDFLKKVQNTAENRGYVRNWMGRRYYFTDKKYSYKAPNHLIQGGAAEIIKIAMNQVDEYLKDKKSRLLLSIHDELIIEVKYGEEYVIEDIKNIMENIYPYKRLPLLVDVEYSEKNLADKKEWIHENLSSGTEKRDNI